MSQVEILELLQKSDEPLTRTQIAEQLGQDRIKVSHLLQKLIKCNDITFVEYDRHETSKRTNMKIDRRTRFYFARG